MSEEQKTLIGINNYCETSHIINEHIKLITVNPYKKLQKCLFYETISLEGKDLFCYDKWSLKE